MSDDDDDSISDPEEINEGEDVKVAQSNFKEPSIITKSILKNDTSQKITEENKVTIVEKPIEVLNESKEQFRLELSPNIEKAETEQSPLKLKKQKQNKITDDVCFEIPKMKTIPILNKDTAHPDRFDLNFLLNPEVQKIAQSGHRLTQSTTINTSNSFASSKNHIKQNIKNAKSHTNSISQKNLTVPYVNLNGKKSFLDVDERFYSKAKKTEERIKALKEVKDMEEINNCTFHPKIRTQRKQKTYTEYYEYMNNFAEKKQQKVKNLQEEEKKTYEKTNDFDHQPKICENSLRILASKSIVEETAFDRLHKFYKYNAKSEDNSGRDSPASNIKLESQKFFHPVINKKTQELQRSDPIEKILYDDALRRLKKNTVPKPSEPAKFTNIKSEQFLINKVKRDFEEGFCSINVDNTGEVNYTRMIEIFKIMHMIEENGKKEEERLLLLDAWKLLNDEENVYCTKETILAFVLAIMGFYEEWMKNAYINNKILSQQEVKKIHKKFDLFYRNRSSAAYKNTGHKTLKDVNEYSFHPHIGIMTDKLADSFKLQNRQIGKVEDILIAEKEKKIKKIEELRLKIEEENMEECSFNPMIEQMPDDFRIYGNFEGKEDLASEYFKLLNDPGSENQHKGVFLYNLSKIYKEKKSSILHELKEKDIIKELKDCTFAPHLEKRVYPDEYKQDEYIKPKEIKIQPSKIIKKEEKKQSSPVKKKIANNKKKIIGSEGDFSFKVINKLQGIAKISVSTGKINEILEFNIKDDDPTNVVMTFSTKAGLKKEDEYKLVKKLTLLKYAND